MGSVCHLILASLSNARPLLVLDIGVSLRFTSAFALVSAFAVAPALALALALFDLAQRSCQEVFPFGDAVPAAG